MNLQAWHRYWLIWFLVMFLTFLGPEIYALATNWRRTLSAWVWSFEREHPGEPISQWTALHFLFIGVFAVVVVWLIFHFSMEWFR